MASSPRRASARARHDRRATRGHPHDLRRRRRHPDPGHRPAYPDTLRLTDLIAAPPASEREVEAQSLLVDAARYSFDLSNDLMLRADLIRLSETRSCPVPPHPSCRLRRLVEGPPAQRARRAVRRLCLGQRCPCPRCRSSTLISPSGSGAPTATSSTSKSAYWKNKLAGAPPLIDLPLDDPRPPRRATAAGGRGS